MQVVPPLRSKVRGALWLAFYRSLVRRYFENVWIRETDPMPSGGYVVAVSHQSEWDSRVLALWQYEHRPKRFCTYANEGTLRSAPMMRWLGAFSKKGEGAEALRDLLRFARERCEAGEPVCFLAEGLAGHSNAIGPLKRGFANVAVAAGVPVVPLVFRYVMRRSLRPEVFIAAGAPLAPSSNVRDEAFAAMTRLYAEIERDVIEDTVEANYRVMLRGKTPLVQTAFNIAGPILALLSRRRR
ncbi:MAG TPA: 1-acyl-sn-glycerol-3-phosphate acyltransferase [Candidatus Baltobacteraceae bacterium]|nr:1-acyl-sn-glycerol-3-phosphate acyltransferase [Candidatus Baltobacteraceae bacterium]